jgi:hypothetical protein
MPMADDVPQARDQRRQAYQDSLRRANDFWQQTLNAGRIARQAEAQARETEKPQQRQRGSYQRQTP